MYLYLHFSGIAQLTGGESRSLLFSIGVVHTVHESRIWTMNCVAIIPLTVDNWCIIHGKARSRMWAKCGGAPGKRI